MGWIIGIDEAGYGPNLGPLVQTAVAFRVPTLNADLWQTLDRAVRKQGKARDHRLTIDDSKKVYGPTHDIKLLERTVAATLFAPQDLPTTMDNALSLFAGPSLAGIQAEEWYRGDDAIPVAVDMSQIAGAAERFVAVCRSQGVTLGTTHALVTMPREFNRALERMDNKGRVLADGVRRLIARTMNDIPPDDPAMFAIDRLGGRKYHTALLETVGLPGRIDTIAESETCCEYRLVGERDATWRFEVEADGRHLPVALASMISKYLREVLMRQFNRWWCERVPGLRPTAGYPVDAARFMAEIRTELPRLGIEEAALWRQK